MFSSASDLVDDLVPCPTALMPLRLRPVLILAPLPPVSFHVPPYHPRSILGTTPGPSLAPPSGRVSDASSCVAAGYGRCRHFMIHLSGLRPCAPRTADSLPPAAHPRTPPSIFPRDATGDPVHPALPTLPRPLPSPSHTTQHIPARRNRAKYRLPLKLAGPVAAETAVRTPVGAGSRMASRVSANRKRFGRAPGLLSAGEPRPSVSMAEEAAL